MFRPCPRPLFVGCLITVAGCLTASSVMAQPPRAKQPRLQVPPGAKVLKNIEYKKYSTEGQGETKALLLDLFLPKQRSGALPVIVFIHGGGWNGGAKEAAYRCAAKLATDGFAIASINYRLTQEAQWPAQINDCYDAVRWIRDHADEYDLDGGRIAVWGGSAGGHLAALVATRPYPGKESTSSRVQALVDWFGPTDLLTMPPNVVGPKRTKEEVAASNGAKLLGATVADVPKLAKDASALHHVSKDDPPTLIMHGEKDASVPLEQSQRLHQALIDVGVKSELDVLPGAGHGGQPFFKIASRDRVSDFLKQALK
ncbi:MAG: alpha/beta hydrolase [Planctomycetota bacterium]